MSTRGSLPVALTGLLLALASLAASVSAALAIPLPGTSRASDRAAWRSLLKWPASCESNWKLSNLAGSGIGIQPAGAGRELVTVECSFAAYQGTAKLYLLGPSHAVGGPLTLETYDVEANGKLHPASETQVLGLLTFTPSTARLTLLDELRGLGDCGVYSTFQLRGSGFVPVSVRVKTACNGKPPLTPSSWPPVANP